MKFQVTALFYFLLTYIGLIGHYEKRSIEKNSKKRKKITKLVNMCILYKIKFLIG